MAQISLTFPDGNVREYAGRRHPCRRGGLDLDQPPGRRRSRPAWTARHFDLQWPIEADATIAIHTMQDEAQALELIRHDLAHIMAQRRAGAVARGAGHHRPGDRERLGTTTSTARSPSRPTISARSRSEDEARSSTPDDPVKTEAWDRDDGRSRYFEGQGENFKVELVEAIPEGEQIRIYRQGDWLDLCRGPHLQSHRASSAEAFKLMKVAGAYWRGDSTQRACCSASTARPGPDREGARRPTCTGSRRPRSATTASSASELDLFHFQEEAPGIGVLAPEGLARSTAR
ncbi:MAG: hypothetical protein MZV65_02280 [Chromatiales bacterium]|nr:hypothetical protein [Chromatiales bacterium]